LNDEWKDNVETRVAELKAQIVWKQEKLKTLQKAINAAKAEQRKQKAAEIQVVRNSIQFNNNGN
jgi:chaperonin cofactor prefoldin